MSIDSSSGHNASKREYRVATPRESDMLRNPLRCAFERGVSGGDEFDDLLAAIDRADRHH